MPPLPDSSDDPPDKALLARVQAGDVEAFGPLVKRHLPSLRAFVALRLPVTPLADEIAHETLVFAFRNIGRVDLAQPFRPWLRAIAANLVLHELRRYGREQAKLSRFAEAELQAWSTEAARPASDESIHLEQCLRSLPENLRRLVQERYEQEQSTAEIANRWGRTLEWVRVTLFRVRRQLRECVELKMAEGGYAK
ncbi:MAG: polymerase sigma-70 factor, subfamily [Chthoniobacter sp.]|jgi:RNA polymerase sigma-70 factor (ECF subfamily)|nr:polymerase sigma-70 factor, subfamily [Chthoniobacter sp.]